MDDSIYFLAKDLRKEMDNDPRFKHLNEINEEMNNNEEVIRLALKKDNLNDKYNDLLRIYDDNNPLVIEARKELIKAKDELDSHPLVKEYLKAYNEVRDVLFEINDILFKEYKGKVC